MRNMLRLTLSMMAVTTLAAGLLSAADPGTGDWPMWGGTPDRNMVSAMEKAPVEWDIDSKKNIVWVSKLGSQTYGNPVVAGGKVFVGTNNEALYDESLGGDRGVLIAFRESDGEFLWQEASEKLKSGRVNDWPYQGVASSQLVVEDRLYYASGYFEQLYDYAAELIRKGKAYVCSCH